MRTLPAAILIATLALLAPGPALAHGGAEVAVTRRPYAGGPIEIEGTDFEEGELVTLELRKEGQAPVLLGSVPVEAGGTFAVTFHVPTEVRPGLYELLATVEDESTSAEVTLLDPPGGSGNEGPDNEVQHISNDRPSAEAAGLGIVTALLAAGGAGIILAGRRRPVRPLQR